jgi:DNA-binding winged helix-turn-helix (wHTH) protein/tetratricopeptide (TPR) repeat protein
MTVADRVNLAHEPDFVLGRLTVSPSRRELVRDDGEREVIEHRVMQVLIALSKAEGSIVTRDELTMSCWDGRVVGEDAIHRVLSRLRKIANGIGASSIEIETITKIGYRLTSNGYQLRAGEAPVARHDAAAPRGWLRDGKRKVAAVAASLILVLTAGLLAWTYLGRSAVPLVAVGPADSSPPSRLLARDLLVKLGTLPQVGAGHWQLVEAGSARSAPNLLFRTAVSGRKDEPHTTLMLFDGKNNRLLWSREFSFPANRESDLRQQLSLTAARALGCALEARSAGGLPPELSRLFLTGCAALDETSDEEPRKGARAMRAIVVQRPGFAPAWARLLMIDSNILQLAENGGGDPNGPRDTLRSDIEQARKIAPDLPEIKLAQLDLLPPNKHAEAFEILRTLKAEAPDNPAVWVAEANALSRIGRMQHAAESARRAAELDPLSPAALRSWIILLAWSGATDVARKELGRAERLWHGTGALRDAQFAFHLRYGDPKIARSLTSTSGYVGNWSDPYLQARLDPSAANIDRLLKILERAKAEDPPKAPGYAVQALGEFHQTDEVFDWLGLYPPEVIANSSYILFRPALADVRRDPRFMQVANRIGLIGYWHESGRWPDFCWEPGLPYDCRQEAARLKS